LLRTTKEIKESKKEPPKIFPQHMTKALSQAKTCAKAFVHLKEKIKQNLKKSPKIKDS
jgi:hypothetical protein